jgi:hypothetical protein
VAAEGGGITNDTSTELVVSNSTIAGNKAIDENGGGILNAEVLRMQHSTVAGNSAETNGGGIAAGGGGSRSYLHNNIVAGNSASLGPDFKGPLHESGYNLFGSHGNISGLADTDIVDVDPLLGPLVDNGGPTLTMALLPGSPAVDAGDPDLADPPEWDQRGPGFPRIVNGRIDIGPFEVQASGAPARNGAQVFSPVHGAFRVAVLGPALTPGAWIGTGDSGPFTGLLGIRLEPMADAAAKAHSSRTPVNGARHYWTAAQPAVNSGPTTADAESPANGASRHIDLALAELEPLVDLRADEREARQPLFDGSQDPEFTR